MSALLVLRKVSYKYCQNDCGSMNSRINIQTRVPEGQIKHRSSNLELFRVICMMMIVAHHYVVNSGLITEEGPITMNPTSVNSLFLSVFGAWGKVGINCFMMITGYYMCTSKITFRKFLKLMGQIYLYKWLIFGALFVAGYETFSLHRVFGLLMPIGALEHNFTSCFVVFWLTIPFLNIFLHNITKRQHELLLILSFGCYTLMGTIPYFKIMFNYVTWFVILYFLASYIRLYPNKYYFNRGLWKWLAIISVCMSIISVVGIQWFRGLKGTYFLVSDCNRFFAVFIAVSSFLWFKNMNIKYSKIINNMGAATFGVLLIHANSEAMRVWLWKDTVDVVGHYSLPLVSLILYSFVSVLIIFIICNLIDQLRICIIEKVLLNWYDNRLSVKADHFVNKMLENQ